MSLQNTGLVVVMGYSRRIPTAGEHLYIATTAVVCSEATKFCCSLFLALSTVSPGEISRAMQSTDALLMLVPAGLYTLQNNLQYVAMSHLDASVYQVLSQMKLVTTALFSMTMLGRRISVRQWTGIFVCAIGIAIVQISSLTGSSSKSSSKSARGESGGGSSSSAIGFVAVMTGTVTSGLAGVFTEKVFKTSNTSMWVRNMQLAMYSVCVGVVGVLTNDFDQVMEKGFFVGYSLLVWSVIALQALGGIVVAVVVKFADNIAKGFSTGISIVVSCALSAVFLDFEMSFTYAVGASCVLLSIQIYSCGGDSRSSQEEATDKWGPSTAERGDQRNNL